MPTFWRAVVALALLPSLQGSASFLRLRGRSHNVTQPKEAYKIRLDNFNNVQYSAPLTLGEQTLPVIYDTGSFEILVLSTLCSTCEHRHAIYDSHLSKTFVASDPDITSEHLFGSGPVLSEKAYEEVRLGDAQSPFTIPDMAFWQIVRHEIDVWDETAHFSGIVGLGHPTRIPQDFAVPGSQDMTMLASMHINTFAFCLEREDSGSEAPGWLVIEPTMPPGSAFQTLEVVGKVHWGVMMTNLEVPAVDAGGAPIANADLCNPSCGAILDSGTSLIAVPNSAAPMVQSLSAMVEEDCSNLETLPVLRFRLGHTTVELPPKAYVMKVQKVVHRGNSSLWASIFEGGSDEVQHCQAAFMLIDKESDHGPIWILGMPFLRYYYTIFDRETKQIHISEASPTCEPMVAEGQQQLLNTTALHSMSGARSEHLAAGRSGRSAADFKPMPMDLNGVRAPAWALGSKGKVMAL